MARQFHTFPALPRQAIAAAATSPDPGKLGAQVWSTVEGCPLSWNGASWQMEGAAASGGGFYVPERLALLEGDALPDPGAEGVGAWSTTLNELMLRTGGKWRTADATYTVPSVVVPDYSGVWGIADDGRGFYQTLEGGGENGSVTSPGYLIFVLYFLDMPTLNYGLIESDPTFRIHQQNNSNPYAQFFNAAGGSSGTISHDPPAALGAYYLECLTCAGTAVRHFGWGKLLTSGTLTTATDAAAKFRVGIKRAFYNAYSYGVAAPGIIKLGVSTFVGNPTTQQVIDALMSARVSGEVPLSMSGATLAHSYDFKPLAAANNGVAPPVVADAVSGLSLHQLNKKGLVHLRRARPCPNNTTIYGLTNTGTTYYALATAYEHASTGFSIGVHGWVSNSGTVLGHYASGTESYRITGAQYYRTSPSADSTYNSGIAPSSAFLFTWGPGEPLRIWVDGALMLESTSYTYVATSASGYILRLLNNYAGTAPIGGSQFAAGGALFGLAMMDLPLTAVEAADWFVRIRNTGKIQALRPDLSTSLYRQFYIDITQDVAANGGPSAGAPATLVDRFAGTRNFARNGTATDIQVVPYTHRTWSYESTPVQYGLSGANATNYAVAASTTISRGNATAFWFALYGQWESTMNDGLSRVLFSAAGSTNSAASGGFYIEYGSNALRMQAANTSNAWVASPNLSPGQQLYQPLLLVFYYQAGALGAFAGGSMSAGSAMSYKISDATAQPRIGCAPWATTGQVLGNFRYFGVAYGESALTMTDFLGLARRLRSSERMAAIPGKTSWYIDFTTDYLAAGAMPTTLVDRQAGAANFNVVNAGGLSAVPYYAHDQGYSYY